MNPHDISLAFLAILAGALLGGGLCWRATRAWTGAKLATAAERFAGAEGRIARAAAAIEAFGSVFILVEDSRPTLVAGDDGLAVVAEALRASPQPAGVIDAIATLDPGHALRLEALFKSGAPCAFEAQGASGVVMVEGRSAGAMAWLHLSLATRSTADAPPPERLADFVDAYPDPAWITGADGTPSWVNQAWLAAVEAESPRDAEARRLTLDRSADALARNAATAREVCERVRWMHLAGRRRALLVRASPLAGGGVGVWTQDVTQAETGAETLRRHVAAHELTLNQIGDAVAMFGRDRRLGYHNEAFARLWDLEPAWLADQPGHGELLDRLRQRRRLPETADHGRFKADELRRYEEVAEISEAIWRLPGERTLRVVGQLHPMGGLVMVFSDITPELRLKAQFNHLIQVQRATLDKLTDAVAVFGADARLKLHNEAFQRLWSVTAAQVAEATDFDGVVELCIPRVHDLHFWRELKGRITDPDPRARGPLAGEVATADRRAIAWQSRPLPDGATLISFADVTDTRLLEGALRDREAALSQAERLKHEFVGSVSYELRTPLTTILGYSELLEREAEALGGRVREYVASVRQAATQLARSIDTVLAVAQIDAGELALDIQPGDVGALLSAAAHRWNSVAGAARISVTDDGKLGMIEADQTHLTQVLDHLIENALRHTPVSGSVTLSAQRSLGEVRLQVSDTGRGIPFHVQAHIFDRFSGQDRGSPGLGLALVKALVELHGGWVALESEPGAGASFTCHLPEAANLSKADLH